MTKNPRIPALLFLLSLFSLPLIAADVSLSVDLSTRQLAVWQGTEITRHYRVAVGSEKWPTPQGTFKIRHIIWNPAWKPPDSKWARKKKEKAPGDPDNPMKRVKIFFSEPDYYIHGTSDTDSMGDAASHGCLRMVPEEAEELARFLMEQTGQPKPDPWYRRILRSRKSKSVWLSSPVKISVRP